MKKILNNIKKFFKTDVKIINSYFLTMVILIILVSVGLTSYALFSYTKISNNLIELTVGKVKTSLDKSGANAPVLASNMIPVYYDETNEVWKKADESNKNEQYPWYSYNSSGEYKGMWANAVTVTSTNRTKYLNAEPGTTIPMSDINTMWVWIPRFKVNTTDFTSISGVGICADSSYLTEDECNKQDESWYYNNPGAIDVTFVTENETAIDAFTFGTKSLSGFWYAKFETSHTTLASSTTSNNLGCTTETCSNANRIIVKPNVVSLRYNNISNFFYASRSMEQTGNNFGFVSNEVDTHMSKNNEWGAVAYLTQSIYGRCTSSTSCTEVGINNNGSYLTGYGAPAGSVTSVTNGAYNTALGKDASTTGTIYGIYDMSGGAVDYVMGVYSKTVGSSGFSNLPNEKYYNNYTGTSYTGHTLTETAGWYSNAAIFVDSRYPWFIRGGYYNRMKESGVFYFNSSSGNANGSTGLRLVITNE